MVKNLPAMWETRVWSLGWEDALEKRMTTHSSILAWRIPCTEEPDRLQSMGSQRAEHDWATNTHTTNELKFYSRLFPHVWQLTTKNPSGNEWWNKPWYLEIITLSDANQTKTNIIWYHLYVESKKWHNIIYSQNRNRLTDLGNKHGYQKGKVVEKDELGVWDNIYILLCIK